MSGIGQETTAKLIALGLVEPGAPRVGSQDLSAATCRGLFPLGSALQPLFETDLPDKHATERPSNTGDDRTGWAYEGFYLKPSTTRRGRPFLVVFNHWRGNHPGGGQWTSDPTLLPFDHG